jgi:hypothetical protein
MSKLVRAPCRHHSYNYREETNKLIKREGGGGKKKKKKTKKLEESETQREREREAEGCLISSVPKFECGE